MPVQSLSVQALKFILSHTFVRACENTFLTAIHYYNKIHHLEDHDMATLVNCLILELMDIPYLESIASQIPGVPITKVRDAIQSIQNKTYPRYMDIRVYRPQWYNFRRTTTSRDDFVSGNICTLGIVEGIPLLSKISDISTGGITKIRVSLAWSLPIDIIGDTVPKLYSRFKVTSVSFIGLIGTTARCDDMTSVGHEEFRSVDICIVPPESYLGSDWQFNITIETLSPWNCNELHDNNDNDTDDEPEWDM